MEKSLLRTSKKEKAHFVLGRQGGGFSLSVSDKGIKSASSAPPPSSLERTGKRRRHSA